MPEQLIIIKIKDIEEINKLFTSVILLHQGLDAIYSSCLYYNSKKEQICNIFLNLIKGHYFVDGNKRTSVVVLLSLIALNNMSSKLTDENLFDITIKIAESHFLVEHVLNLIF
ncbi:MAG: type II toxin-antitoxin system death-on-curing family toxin [Desulfovibrionaceae bacterium]|nr:type II toxin-antitoxin system death-on-curing family toxin [Desulfovibrionaceae bacterium]